MRVVRSAIRVAQYPRQQARDSIYHDKRGQLSAGQHVIANGDFIRGQMQADAFIHPFVAAADECDPGLLCEFLRDDLIENSSLWRQQNDGVLGLGLGFGGRNLQTSRRFLSRQSEHRFNRLEHRLRFHHHPASAAIRYIIRRVMFVVGVVPNVVNAHVDQPSLAGALKDAAFEIGRKNFRQKRENIELHEAILA